MKEFIKMFIGAMIIAGLIYGSYWLVKNISYAIFYEDMVVETIKETVKPEYLIER